MATTLTVDELKAIYIELAKVARSCGYRPKVKQNTNRPEQFDLCLGWDWDEQKGYDKFEEQLFVYMDKYGIPFSLCADADGSMLKVVY